MEDQRNTGVAFEKEEFKRTKGRVINSSATLLSKNKFKKHKKPLVGNETSKNNSIDEC